MKEKNGGRERRKREAEERDGDRERQRRNKALYKIGVQIRNKENLSGVRVPRQTVLRLSCFQDSFIFVISG